MIKRELLTTTEAINSVLRAYVRVGNFGAIFTFYKDISTIPWTPNNMTYHTLLDAVLDNPYQSNCRKIVGIIFKALQGQNFKPDHELLQKLVQCCTTCDETKHLEMIAESLDNRDLKSLLQVKCTTFVQCSQVIFIVGFLYTTLPTCCCK